MACSAGTSGWDLLRMAAQLTSLSTAIGCATAEAQWQTDAHMPATLAQVSYVQSAPRPKM